MQRAKQSEVKKYLYEKRYFSDFQITYAKTGKYNLIDGVKFLTLYNGNTINNVNNKISNFTFSNQILIYLS